jgi:hypothetical protein
MWHIVLIAMHAIAGLVAFVTGCVTLRRGRLFEVYLWSLVGMTLFLLLVLAVDWAAIGIPARLLFSAFVVLSGFMVWRAALARRLRPAGSTGPSASYLEHVGFTLIALFDAFAVVAILDAGAPIWLVVLAGVLIGIAGNPFLRLVKRRLTYDRSPAAVRAPAVRREH